jgi:hypothetical protein
MYHYGSVPDPDPDPYVFGPPGSASGSVSYKYGSGSGSFPFLIKALSRLKNNGCKIKFEYKNCLAKNLILKLLNFIY